MFYNILAAEMLLGITDENLEWCKWREGDDDDKSRDISVDDDYWRNYLGLLFLVTCSMDYIKEAKLAEDSDLYLAMTSKIAKIMGFFTQFTSNIGHDKGIEYIKDGVIPIDANTFDFIGEHEGVYEIKKALLDAVIGGIGDILTMGVFVPLMDKKPIDYPSLGDWMKLNLDKVMVKRGRAGVLSKKGNDTELDFDL